VQQLPPVAALAASELLESFVPTRRFAGVSFDTYEPDARYASQQRALERMREFVGSINKPRRRLPLLSKKPIETARAIYLDGGYGVGKTHLLAATYHASNGKRYYLSFAELAYAISRLGMQQALEAFHSARLLCIDEFELDDVAQTRMASMFLRQFLQNKHAHVVTTSNTLPSDLGQGRFAADAFRREIGDIAALFEAVTIDGEDYRHRHWDDLARGGVLTSEELSEHCKNTLLSWPDLAEQLQRIHPIHYAQVASQLDTLCIDELDTIPDQAVALRLVHFVDKLYDQEVRLSLSSRVPITEIFSKSYRHGGYEKKYRRCLSRLHELLGEGVASQVKLG
jgi:cell division protein ZapE